MLEKTRKVLTWQSCVQEVVHYSQIDEESNEAVAELFITRDDWLDMDRPPYVTVTIEPGDQLNAGV